MKKKFNLFKVIFAVYVLSSIAIIIQMMKLNEVLPVINYIALGLLVVLGLALYHGIFKNKSKIARNLSKFLIVVLGAVLVFSNVYVYKYGLIMNNILGQDNKIDTVSVIVKESSSYRSLKDVKDLDFVIEDAQEDIVTEAIESFKSDLGQEISTIEEDNYIKMAEDLESGKYEVIVVNEAYRNFIEDEIPEFSKSTRVIKTYSKTTEMAKSDKNVTQDVFSVMISGIDVYGNISNNARSDVNILAVVNPNTKKIVLVSIPRDYYLPFTCKNNTMDKLTHTGIYGVDCTMGTVGALFERDVDYFVRVNFTSLVTVVDTIGGVDVYNENAFSTGEYSFPQGQNHLNGAQSLSYVRDRKHQADGDSGRGRHQVDVLTAIINKMLTPAQLMNFNGLMNALDGSFQTNLSNDEINSLVKMQLKDGANWDIIQEQVSGTGARDFSYALGGNYYVMYPDMSSVERVKNVIQSIE